MIVTKPDWLNLDRVGIIASAACVVHCLLTPVLLLFLPVFGARWSDGIVHWVLAALVLPLALVVLYRGFSRHRTRWVLAMGAIGATGITLGLVLPLAASAGESGAAIAVNQQVVAAMPATLAFSVAPAVVVAGENDCGSCDETSCAEVKPVMTTGVAADGCDDKSCSDPEAEAVAATAAESCDGCTDHACGDGQVGTTQAVAVAVEPPASDGVAAMCQEACCPQLVQNPETGTYSLAMTPASIVTILGSILLVIAHGGNLKLCARCEGSCGADCPQERAY